MELKETGLGGRLNGSSRLPEEVKVLVMVITQVNIMRASIFFYVN